MTLAKVSGAAKLCPTLPKNYKTYNLPNNASFRNLKKFSFWIFQTKWMLNNSLAGAMMWSLDLDDFSNRCKNGKFPLTTAMRYAIDNAEEVTIPMTSTIPVTTVSEMTPPTQITTTKGSTASHLFIVTITQLLLYFAAFNLLTQYLSNIS